MMLRMLKKVLKVTVITLLVIITAIYIFMQQASFGKNPSGKRLKKIEQSPNYKSGSFANLLHTVTLAEGASYIEVIKRSLKKDARRTPSKALPYLPFDTTVAGADKPVITWFGHSSYLIQIGTYNILVDPVFSKRASFAQWMGPSAYPGTEVFNVASLPHIDAIVISHDHYDHLDYNTITQLKDKVGAFYVPLGVGAHLEYWGVPVRHITELDWWQETTMTNGMNLAATPARHFSGRGLVRNKTLWASFVLQTGAHRIYIGGDSGYGPHFKEIGNKYGSFDVVILENGQYDANWPQIHMMPEETVQAAIDLKGKVLFPVHWGKFTLSVHPWNDPIIRVTKSATEQGVHITTPKLGERIVMDASYPSEQWWNF